MVRHDFIEHGGLTDSRIVRSDEGMPDVGEDELAIVEESHVLASTSGWRCPMSLVASGYNGGQSEG